MDAEGYLFVVDRLKELIKYKAFQVAPATLEDILLRHKAVADVGVIGFPDEEAGELPRAYVVKKPGKNISEKELQDFVAGNIFQTLSGSLPYFCAITTGCQESEILPKKVMPDNYNNVSHSRLPEKKTKKKNSNL